MALLAFLNTLIWSTSVERQAHSWDGAPSKSHVECHHHHTNLICDVLGEASIASKMMTNWKDLAMLRDMHRAQGGL